VRSISDTWLRFPVGSGCAYSNLGIDLAGYILERVEGKPFAQVMRDSQLGPLGMDHSTFDRAAIRATVNRAVGHVHPYPKPPLDEPMTAAGGLYASAADLTRRRFTRCRRSRRRAPASRRSTRSASFDSPLPPLRAQRGLDRRPTPLEPLGATT
jgi:CubicO group peptidase (beta-lactamase class C family)